MSIRRALPTFGPAIRTGAIALVMLAVVASEAMAGGSTLSIGARTRRFQPALVGEFWIGRLGFSAEAGIGFSEADQTDQFSDGSSDVAKTRASTLQAGAAMYFVLARGKRSQLSAGIHYGYGRAHTAWDKGGRKDVTSYSEVTVPIRFQVWVVDRLSLYVELGMGVRDTKTEATYGQSAPLSESNSRQLITVGDPLGNAGVSFHF